MFPLTLLLAASAPAQPPTDQPPVPSQPIGIPKPYTPSQGLPVPREAARSLTEFIGGPPAPVQPATKCDLPNLADCLRACPPANDPAPFLRLPKVSVVEECQTAAGDGKCDPACIWKHTWHTAAKFTVPRFDPAGEPMDGDALVIYEGMTLTVNQLTGVYDLSFTATHPPIPVTLRLQLAFVPPPERLAEPVRLTLPPIRFDADNSTDTDGRTVRVHHRGQSDLFIKPRPIPNSYPYAARSTDLDPFHPQPDDRYKVVRLGTARFGSARTSSGELDR